jgi:hypothetical protein
VAYKLKNHAVVASKGNKLCSKCYNFKRHEAKGEPPDGYIVECREPVRRDGSAIVYYRRNFWMPYRSGYVVFGVNDRMFTSEEAAMEFIEAATETSYAPIAKAG